MMDTFVSLINNMENETFYLPIRLITHDLLSYSARRLGAILYGACDENGSLCVTLEALSGHSGLAVCTVRKAVDQLEYYGVLTRRKQPRAGILYYLNMENESILIPRSLLLDSTISSSAFIVRLYRYYLSSGKQGSPSLKGTSAAVHMAKSTVCTAVKRIRQG